MNVTKNYFFYYHILNFEMPPILLAQNIESMSIEKYCSIINSYDSVREMFTYLVIHSNSEFLGSFLKYFKLPKY